MNTFSIPKHYGAMIVGIAGLELTLQEADRLRSSKISAVILFARNYVSNTQLLALCNHIHALKQPALSIYVDQEGGRVQRFIEGFTRLPALHDIGEVYEKKPAAGIKLAQEVGLTMASELRACGIDYSFAPVVDLYDPRSRVINCRAFHRDPQAVIELGGAMINGMSHAGMPAILKHFPGHGLFLEDTHLEKACDNVRTLSELWQEDLWPYRTLLSCPEVQGVMVGHLVFNEICQGKLTSQSVYWLQEILRKQLAFAGKIFSDDLGMIGVQEGGKSLLSRQNACVQAGCDFVIWSQPQDWQLILQSME